MDKLFTKILLILGMLFATGVSIVIAAFAADNWPTRVYKHRWYGDIITRTDFEMICQGAICSLGIILSLVIFIGVFRMVYIEWKRP